jgi:hypothetical protein
VSALYEANKMDEAKSVMKAAQTEVLHNIVLASYFKAHGSSGTLFVGRATFC